MNDYPDLSLFLQNLWMRENAEGLKAIEGKGGYRDGKYFPYKTKNGNTDIGPGFDMEHQTPEFRKRAVKGFTKEELDSIVLDRAQKEIPNLKRRIVKEGGNPDRVSDNVYNGLLDMYWQIDNGLYKYNNLWKGVAQGDYEKIRNESATYYDSKNGKIPKNAIVKNGKILDSGRWEFRKNTYFKEPEEPVVSSKEMPVSTEPTLPVVTVDPTPIHREYTDAIRNYRQPVTPSNTKRDAYKAMQDKVNFNRFMDSISIQNTLPPAYEPQSNLHSEGGQMETVKLWEELSIPEKAAMMRVAVKNGITNLQDIKREYNEFAKGGPKKKPSVNGNAQRAMDYFMNKGLSQHQAAGLVGNLMRESGMSPTAVNSSSGAYGLAQWLGSRKKALFNKYGNNPTLNQQLDFVWNELNSTHKKGLKALKSSKSAEEAARNAMGYYEFMAGPDAAVREMRKYGQDGEGSMRKGINYASILMGHSPSKSPIVPTTPITPINPSISQESLESPIPFTPFNPEAFFATPETYQQPIVVEEPEAQEPVAISPYSPEEIERQERMNRLSAFNKILSLTNPYPQEEDSFLSTIGLLTSNTFSKGGGIHIKPENRGKFTALKKENRTFCFLV